MEVVNLDKIMKFSKTRKVKSPSRGTDGSAGIDFYVPEDFGPVHVRPGDSILIPSGIKVNIPPGNVLIGFNKSGVAVKKRLQIGACVIDQDYQGEIFIHLTNISPGTSEVKPGDKIVQFLYMPVHYCEMDEVEPEHLYEAETKRGEGGFGSTGC